MTVEGSVTVVGNGVSGYACARSLATAGVPVTLIGPGLPCDRPPLSKRALTSGRIPFLATTTSLAQSGITHLDGWAAGLDLRCRRIEFTPRIGGAPESLGFELLVWATGLRPMPPPIPGIEHCHENANAPGLGALLPMLARPPRRVTVVGAGLIGSETAATLSRDHEVTLIERSEHVLGRFHPDVGGAVKRVLRDLGVTLIRSCVVRGIEPSNNGTRVVQTATHGDIHADVVITAAGILSTLPEALGPGSVAETDNRLAANTDGVWVCGDLAAFPHPRFGRIAVPHWDNARASGMHAAGAILGAKTPFVRNPYWFSNVGPLRIQQIGFAPAVCSWSESDGLRVGRGHDDRAACVLMLNTPHRMNDARRLLAA
jgi:NADPH-dependent 2,4-dienoyl-CoA reductase/sulfur reductase-like enzyme